MNAGEVENPGAFDSDEKTAKTTPVGGGKNPPEPSQIIDPDEPIGDDGVNYDVYADEAETNTSASTSDTKMQFSADDIRKRKKTNFFVNIRGAKKLEREAERKHAADEKRILAEQRRAERETAQAEKAAAANRARKQSYNDAQEKSALKEIATEEKRQRKRIAADKRKTRNANIRHAIANFFNKVFWYKWHKFVTITFLVALAIFGILAYRSYQYYLANILPKEQKNQAVKEEKSNFDKSSFEFRKQLDEKYQQNNLNNFSGACKWAEETIASAKENNSSNYFLYSLEYAKFIVQHTEVDWEKSLNIILGVEDLATTDYMKYELYNSLILVYRIANNEVEVNHYTELLDSLNLTTEGEGAIIYE